jgi:hypothetical protein
MLPDDVKILGERTDPVLTSELLAILAFRYKGYDLASVAHLSSPVSDFDQAGLPCGRVESWRLHVSSARWAFEWRAPRSAIRAIQLHSTCGIQFHRPATIDVAQTNSGLDLVSYSE